MIDPHRIHPLSQRPVDPTGDHVLYWMVATRRADHSFALDHALDWCRRLGKPLLVFEPLRAEYPHRSERFHTFVAQGMDDQRAAFDRAGIRYLSWIEPTQGAARGLLEALAARACVVITDLFPTGFLPSMVRSAAQRLPVRVEAVDSLGVVPVASAPKAFTVAHAFRRHLHKQLRPHLDRPPQSDPLAGYDLGLAALPDLSRWPGSTDLAVGGPGAVALRGGTQAGRRQLATFLAERLPRYADGRNHPDQDAASGLSPWLHFGHLAAWEVVRAVLDRDGWTPDDLSPTPTGQREGWWNTSPEVEAFLDELITWREVGHVFAHHVPDHDRYDTLPDWALQTLNDHRGDPRELVSLERLEAGRSGDPIWDAAQRQLVRTGVMHNYLRMLWGKKVLAWSATPEEALSRLLLLNDRYALDGRDPNSISGIFWVFGRFDRAWGPERPIFGKVRYMTSDATRKKLQMTDYLARFGPRVPR